MKKISILHVVYHMGAGGLEHVILDMCKNLSKSRFTTYVLCLEACEPEYKLPFADHHIPIYIIKKAHRFDISFYMKFVAFIRNLKIDIIHIHSCLFDSILCARIANIKKTVYTAHGMPVYADTISWFQDFVSLRLVSHIAAVSGEIVDDFAKRLKLPRERCQLLYNGVDTSVFSPTRDRRHIALLKQELGIPPETIIIGSVGRHEKVKNYSMLIKAFRRLISLVDGKLHLALVGNGTERCRLERLCSDLNIAKYVSFLGIRHDIPQILSILDVFALSSFSEGHSIALLEAQAKGIPAIVSDVGGNSNIVKHGYNGFLCKANDYNDMAEMIAAVLKNRNLRNEMENNCRSMVLERFDLSSMVRAYEQLYEALIF